MGLKWSTLLASSVPIFIIVSVIQRYLDSTTQKNDDPTNEDEFPVTEGPSASNTLDNGKIACEVPATSSAASISVFVSDSAAAVDAGFAFGFENSPPSYLIRKSGIFPRRTTSRFFPSSTSTASATQCYHVNKELFTTTKEDSAFHAEYTAEEYDAILSDPFAVSYVNSIVCSPPNSA
ncbi:hypothetical protein JCM33374_g260 [Metschnikowia sp. JCM 33374]|nr:hypothetical protein JCM33374_g260 [Metschnikowia sp. JCM 33374]